jgi:methionine sulfoxide reductase heme-binding subunit
MTNSSTLFWIISRAAGTTAIILASAAVGVGLVMGGKLIKGGGGADRRSIHEILSLATMVAIAVHGLALLGDTWLHSTLLDVTVPFFWSFRTLSTSIGIIAGWGMIVLGLSYYARKRIGLARWKMIHRFTALAWLLGLVHTFAGGTDAGKLWFIALVGLTAAPALGLLVVRLRRRRAPAAGRPRRQNLPDGPRGDRAPLPRAELVPLGDGVALSAPPVGG